MKLLSKVLSAKNETSWLRKLSSDRWPPSPLTPFSISSHRRPVSRRSAHLHHLYSSSKPVSFQWSRPVLSCTAHSPHTPPWIQIHGHCSAASQECVPAS
jgi:hypothetical protein